MEHTIRNIRRQEPHEAVDIANWAADEDFPIYPIGSQPKRTVIAPGEAVADFLIAGQGYLFKQAQGWQAQQMWCEVIAYRLSFVFGVVVPPAFVAIDSATGRAGALIELFYPYPSPQKTIRLVHAADYMQLNFADGKKGRPHALRENLAICEERGVAEPLAWWTQAILFDTLIGNTDRHSENWGFVVARNGAEPRFALAPLYDNGTSLGYGTPDEKLQTSWRGARMAAYIAKGHHDIGWSKDEDGPTPHLVLCERFFEAHPEQLGVASSMLAFADADVQEIADWAVKFDVPILFQSGRGRFIVEQISARRDALKKALGL